MGCRPHTHPTGPCCSTTALSRLSGDSYNGRRSDSISDEPNAWLVMWMRRTFKNTGVQPALASSILFGLNQVLPGRGGGEEDAAARLLGIRGFMEGKARRKLSPRKGK